MTISFTLNVSCSTSDSERRQLNEYFDTDNGGSSFLPYIKADTIRLSSEYNNYHHDISRYNNNIIIEEVSTPPFAAVFCPSTLVHSACEKPRTVNGGGDKSSSNNDNEEHAIQWIGDTAKISRTLLGLIHPFLERNFTIKGILTKTTTIIKAAATTVESNDSPSDIILLDLSHTPYAAIVDLLDSTNCQVIHSGPEAILKIVLLGSIQFTNNNKNYKENVATTTVASLIPSSAGDNDIARPKQDDDNDRIFDLPTCPVCIHRIDPLRLGLPRPNTHQLCSKFCPPPNLMNTTINAGDSCPRQRLLRPWPPPNYCKVCQVIRNYWLREEEEDGYLLTSNRLVCEYCDMQETLWLCSTCAFVGCGRYSNRHMAKHFSETNHPYCIELSTMRIWSYADGEFAHRVDLLECPSSPPLLLPWIVRGSGVASMSANVDTVASMDATTVESTVTKPESVRSNNAASHDDYERLIAANFASVDDKSPKKAIMIGEEYEALLQSALEEQAQHFEGHISWLRAKLTSEQVDQDKMTAEETAEINNLRAEIASLRSDIDHVGKELLNYQAQEAGHRATSQRLLREQRVSQDLLKKIQEETAVENEQGRMQIEELEQQIADLTANQRMMEQFSKSEDLKNSQIFGTEKSPEPKTRKGKKTRKFFRR